MRARASAQGRACLTRGGTATRQAREALLRRALQHAPPDGAAAAEPNEGGADDAAVAALRALRSRLLACQARRARALLTSACVPGS
jgi:hypothetical protein